MFECSVSIFDFIKLHLELQVTFNLRLQEAIHRVFLRLKLFSRLSHSFSDNLARDLVNIDVTLGQLLTKLVSQIVPLFQRRYFGCLQNLSVLQHLVFVTH